MSGKTTGKVWDLELPLPQKIVLLAMADRADHNDENIHPGMPLVAWMTGYSERQVRRIVKQLLDNGLLEVIATDTGKPTSYRIDFSKGVQKPEFNGRDYKKTPDKAKSPHRQGKTHDIAVTPVITVSPLTSHGSEVLQTPDIASAKTASNGIKENGIKERESTHVPFAEAQKLNPQTHDMPLQNDTAAQMQADVFMRAYEQVCKAKGAPQTLPRTWNNKQAGAQFYRDGYSADEIRAVTEKSIIDGKLIPFCFLGEHLAQLRIAKSAKLNGGAAVDTSLVPDEWGVDSFLRTSVGGAK